MPQVARTPPQASVPAGGDDRIPQDSAGFEQTTVSQRSKRKRVCYSPDKNFEQFKDEITEMLRTWKSEQDSALSKLHSNSDLHLSPNHSSSGNQSPDASNVTLRKKNTDLLSSSANSDQYVTEGSLREIIKQELSSALQYSIKELVTDQLKYIQAEISEFKTSFGFFNGVFEEFKKRFEQKEATINQLHAENLNLKKNVSDLTTRLSIVEQNMRENNVEINGLPEDKTENLVNMVLNIAKISESDISDSDILQVTRVAKLNKESDRPRSVIAKLRSPRQRDTLLASVSAFNKKHPLDKLNSVHLGIKGSRVPIFVSEHLSPSSKQLHASTRTLAKELSYQFVWVRNGRIFVRKDIHSKSIYIRDQDSLKRMKTSDETV